MVLTHKLFSQLDGRNVDLLINVSSDAVHASLYYFSQGETPRLLAHTHTDLNISAQMDIDQAQDELLSVLPGVCDDIARKSQVVYEIDDLLDDHQGIHHVTLLLSSPWTDKQVRSKSQDSDSHHTKIDQNSINQLVDTDIPQGRAKIDTFISNLSLNGYNLSLDQAMGKDSGDSLTINCLDSFARFDHIETMFQVIQTKFNVDESNILVRPFSSAMFNGIGEVLNIKKDRVVLYIHAQHIDVFIFNNNQILSYTALGYGCSEIISQLQSKKISHTVAQTHSILKTYLQGHLEEKTHNKVQDILDIEVEVMRDIMNEELEIISPDIYIPKDWYVVTDSELASVFAKKISEKFTSHDVHLVEPDHLHDIIDTDQSDPASTGVLLSGMYIDRFRSQPQE